MDEPWSVSQWIEGVKTGDAVAAQRLWERYFRRLTSLARQKLRDAPRRTADEEDAALAAFASFCAAAQAGRFPQLSDRRGLWRLLVKITGDKAVDQIRRQSARIRGGGQVRGESAFRGADRHDPGAGIEQVIGQEPTPELAVLLTEEFQQLLDCLGDAQLKAIALATLEGHCNQEIAAKIGCGVRTVERRLGLIRARWQRRAAENR